MIQVDPAVVFLQAVAFAILFLLLRQFLFAPLLTMMQERQKKIDEGLDKGERAERQLARIDQERERVLGQAREEGREQVRQSVQEGQEARDRILRDAREEAQQIRDRAREAIEIERQEAMVELRNRVVELALMAANRAVLARLDEKKHRQIVDEFISQLEEKQ